MIYQGANNDDEEILQRAKGPLHNKKERKKRIEYGFNFF